MLRPFLFLALLLCAAPAAADVTGRYRQGDQTIVIEANDAGLIRVGQEGGSEYSVFDGDQGYAIGMEDGRPLVMRFADMMAALQAQMARLLGEVAEPDEAEPAPAAAAWQAAGPASVEGRTGVEYRFPGESLAPGERIVLSDDARLAPLGLAWSRVFGMMPSLGGLLAPAGTPSTRALGEVLARRAPLQLGGIRLVEASFEPIDPARFALPAEPLSRAAVEAQLQAGMSEAATEAPQ